MATNLPASTLPCNPKCPKNQSCPYFTQLQTYEYSREALEHFDMYSHEMMKCCHGKVCNAFQRLNGGGYRLDDRSHCAIYKHPSRRDNAHIEKTLGSKKFISAPLYVEYNKDWNICNQVQDKVIELSDDPKLRLNVANFIEEIRKNGFEWVMQVPNGEDKPADNSGLFVTFFSFIFGDTPKTLWDVAKEKMEHPRHIQMGKPLLLVEILAILLYTGTDIYRELRLSEMLHWSKFTVGVQSELSCIDFENLKLQKRKWPILSSVLSLAILKLDRYDTRCKPDLAYHGLGDINVDPKTFTAQIDITSQSITNIPMPEAFMYGTFVSTSIDREVAVEFMKSHDNKPNNGCLIKIMLQNFEKYGSGICIGADVSWISKFPHEKEFLIDKCQGFQFISSDFDPTEGYQIVKLIDIRNVMRFNN